MQTVQSTRPSNCAIYQTSKLHNLPDQETVQSTIQANCTDCTIYQTGKLCNLPDHQTVQSTRPPNCTFYQTTKLQSTRPAHCTIYQTSKLCNLPDQKTTIYHTSKLYKLPDQQTVQSVQGLCINTWKIFQYKVWLTITWKKYITMCMALQMYICTSYQPV